MNDIEKLSDFDLFQLFEDEKKNANDGKQYTKSSLAHSPTSISRYTEIPTKQSKPK